MLAPWQHLFFSIALKINHKPKKEAINIPTHTYKLIMGINTEMMDSDIICNCLLCVLCVKDDERV